VFYKALGYAVWNLGFGHLRRRYERRAKIALALVLVSLAAVGYMAKRSSE
jgi:hypothetical protein